MTCIGRSFCLGLGFIALSALAGCGEEPTPVPAARELKIVANDGAAQDSFGASVAISGDTAVVGAVFDDDLGMDSGSAYVFVRADDGSWSQQAKLVAPDGQEGDWFGIAVAISDDTVIVGAANAVENGVATGAAHVFLRNGEDWQHEAKLVPSAGAADDQFGFAVALAGDVALVGTPADDDVAMDAGAAYAFKRAGGSWTEQAKLVPMPGGAAGYFGAAVALSNSTALVGAWDDGSGKGNGIAFVFATDGMSWTPQATLSATDGANGDTFGYSVALSGDTALVGAIGSDAAGADSGAAYVFIRNGSEWSQDVKLLPSDGTAGDAFGSSVSIWDDLATIGAYWDDDRGDFSGSAYAYAQKNGVWVEQAKHAPPDGIAGHKFGCAAALDGDLAVVGAYGDDDKGTESGSVYVFSVVESP
ncbi:MAG: FG-GAP repeat protein [Polyangiaceae bacterium]|nr:FG-GAP repeat protein [Polyangiaceae bacterium]